jgi:hypothetical protein
MFANGIKSLTNGGIDFDTDTIKAALMKQSFVATSFNETARDAWDFLNDIPDADIAKNTFKTVTTCDIVIDSTNDNVDFAGGTVSLTFPTVTNGTECGGILIFKSLAQETTSPLICFSKFASTVTADGGTVTVTLNTNGLFRASFD